MNEIAVLDRESPNSVVNKVPAAMKLLLEEMERKHANWLQMAEPELKREVFGKQTPPPAYVNSIRLQFWTEYNRSLTAGTNFIMDRVYQGTCSAPTFYRVIKQPELLAWIVCPPMSYAAALEEGLITGISEIRKIFDLPNTDAKGKVNRTVIEAKLKVFAMLDARKHGAVVQRIEQKNLNLHASTKDVDALMENLTKEDLDKRLAVLESRTGAAPLEIPVEALMAEE